MASDFTHGLLSDVKKNKFSLSTTLSEDDIFQIWDNVAGFIERTMQSGKGVHIQNFGNFCFMQNKLDVGNNKYMLIQRPVFQLSEKLCQTHQLHQTKYHVTGSVPIVQLNYTMLSLESPFSRDQVESCVRDMCVSLSQSMGQKRNVEMNFGSLGRLQIRDGRVKFKFYKEFVNSLDRTGSIVQSMQNRAGTADSVMSNRLPSRSFSVALPKLSASGQFGTMPAISENETTGNDLSATDRPEYQLNETRSEADDLLKTSRSQSQRMCSSAPVASGIDLNDLIPSNHSIPRSPAMSGRSLIAETIPEQYGHEENQYDRAVISTPLKSHGSASADGSVHFSDVQLRQESESGSQQEKILSPKMNLTPPRPPSSAASNCGHTGAGQELCYLCHQRARRNIPVSFTAEIRRREEEEDRAILAYAQMRDTENLMQEQENLLAKKHDSQKITAFNIGASEAIRAQRNAKDPNFHPSFIFQHRPYTPNKLIKQNELSSELGKQVEEKESTLKRNRADENFLERLEQVQLAEDLAAQRDAYLREKNEQQSLYRNALSAQVRYKPVELPPREPDSKEPIFGKSDITLDKMLERRRLAQHISQEQLNTVANKKREEFLRRVQQQRHEETVLQRCKEDLLMDRAQRYQRSTKTRHHLEEDWSQMAQKKRQRELIEQLRASTPGHLLHEQCDKYHRCGQCKRKMMNTGESSVWCDSYYIPGSRFIC